MKIYVLRHGLTPFTEERRYMGRTDLPLSPAGRAALSRKDFSPRIVYTSPMYRAEETADIFFPDAIRIAVPGFEEFDFGIFEGYTADEMKDWPEYKAWLATGATAPCPEGESVESFGKRVVNAFVPLVDRALDEGRDDLTIVAHGGTQMAILYSFADVKKQYWDWMTKAGGGHLLTVDAETWKAKHVLHWEGEVE